MAKKEFVYFEYVPEDFTHNITITIRCKKSERHGEWEPWFDGFKRQRELDLIFINKEAKRR